MSFHVVKQVLDRSTGTVILPDGREFSLRALALYHGRDADLASQVVRNLKEGIATVYSREPRSGVVKVDTWRYKDGKHGIGSDYYFELKVDDPVDGLADASTSRFQEEQGLFNILSPEDIEYINNIRRTREVAEVTRAQLSK